MNIKFGRAIAGVFVAALALHGCGGLPDGSDRGSQPAEVRQRMGSTEIALVYNRPSSCAGGPSRSPSAFGAPTRWVPG
jgi:hypothetical protein